MYERIVEQSKNMIEELLSVVPMNRGEILVVGCSSSEIVGQTIGKGSDFNAAKAVYEGIAPVLREKGIRVESLAIVDSMDTETGVVFRN